MAPPATPTIAYLGPGGTFTEEALLTQPDYAVAELVPKASLDDVLEAVASGQVDLGFIPIENSIEGSVLVTLDSLVFEVDLLIRREVVLDIHLAVVGLPGSSLGNVSRIVVFPFAASQCRRFLTDHLPGVEVISASSNADTARLVGEDGRLDTVALSTSPAASLYGLQVLVPHAEDHAGNQTRFVAVARQGVPARSGHDKTSIVCFQSEDRPGSLHAILSEFSARSINLTKLESRPTKQGLGDYCFIVDLEGHIEDEVVADCLRVLHAEQAGVKFLGSYPAGGPQGPTRRREAESAWQEADAWVQSLRDQMDGGA